MSTRLHLFEGYGVELEYMLVDRETLAVAPICDRILAAATGEPLGVTEVEDGPIGWSNELSLHVLEVKTNGPVPALDDGVAEAFLVDLRRIEGLAEQHGARLLPTAMHPTMDPATDTVLWPHDGRPIYATYDRVFGCRGHGWSNLQSCHLNLPFGNAEEFGRLHLAIRAVLPLLPGLAASSPVVEGALTGHADTRLRVYADNQRRIASIIGDVIPEAVDSPQAYQTEILEPMYRDVAPHDPDGILQHEWLNSRGAIARFERDAIEIRLLDVQETPVADVAIARLVAEAVRALTEERWVGIGALKTLPGPDLRRVLDSAMTSAEEAVVDVPPLLSAFGLSEGRLSVGEVWTALHETLLLDELPRGSGLAGALKTIAAKGPLSRRILGALGRRPDRAKIDAVYRAVGDCLTEGRLFVGL